MFLPWGLSHLGVLTITVLGGIALVALGRRGPTRAVRAVAVALALALVGVTLGYQLVAFDAARPGLTLPLQLSDLAPYAAAWAVVSRRRWAYALTYYWGLTLSVQALLTPALGGGDFPAPSFLVFFTDHVLVVWLAVLLTWGLGRHPSWRDYRFTLVATVCWAVPTQAVNAVTGANYGYLDHKPETASLLDVLGPWPWYLLVEAALVVGVWALITVPWTRRRTHRGRGERVEPSSCRTSRTTPPTRDATTRSPRRARAPSRWSSRWPRTPWSVR